MRIGNPKSKQLNEPCIKRCFTIQVKVSTCISILRLPQNAQGSKKNDKEELENENCIEH